VQELVPEFFSLPEMLTNSNDYKFGRAENGIEIDDVILPKWAHTPEDFIRINRAVNRIIKSSKKNFKIYLFFLLLRLSNQNLFLLIYINGLI
jgi:hypothetical protein